MPNLGRGQFIDHTQAPPVEWSEIASNECQFFRLAKSNVLMHVP
jgi:hypothetical protein